MHATRSQIVKIIMRQSHTANQDSYDPTHIQKLSHHIAENTE